MLKLGELNDLPYLLNFAKSFHQASQYAEYDFNEDKIVKLFIHLMESPNSLVLVKQEQEPVGVLLALMEETIFGRDKIAMELMWWVEPEYRGGSQDMIDAYEFWANKMSCKLKTLSSLAGEAEPILHRVYTRKGFNPAERTYLKVN